MQESFLTWGHQVRKLAFTLLNTLFPPVCANCKRPGKLLCEDCFNQLTWLSNKVCQQCGRLCRKPTMCCFICKTYPLPLKQIKAAVLFDEPIPHLIHQMKYNGMFGLGKPLADIMVQAWQKYPIIDIDLVACIPLHPKRYQERGYNQSELLTQYFCWQLDLPFYKNVLRRIRYTPPQVGLSAADRRQNVKDAFQADHRLVAGKNVLLIDDVCTTGATLSVAAEAMLSVGANTVSGYCLARAM